MDSVRRSQAYSQPPEYIIGCNSPGFFSNTCLIYLAKPDATLVAGYRAWQAKGHQVRRGEKAIPILAPVTRTVPIEDANGRPVLDPSGRPATRRQMVGVRVAHVFDASQVEPPPQIERPRPTLLVGQAPPGLWDSLAQLVTGEGFTVTRGDCQGANGYTDFAARQVRVRADVDDAQAVRTLSHEAAHVFTMDPADIATYGARQCRGVLEVIAESTAYLITQAHGLDAGQYTFNYVAGWAVEAAGRDHDLHSLDETIRTTGERVIAAAHRILTHTQPAGQPIDDVPTSATITPMVSPAPGVWETVTAAGRPRGEVMASPARSRGRSGPSLAR
ncbi:MAG: serine/arginine repetitive matrix protein 2 [Propionibacteriaceae bacterium]|nr:serine/arginine repetitive matrix protein 2 [Propionibacteriaceae bacterium]